ncbi:unnamed protein product [Enterobius vermicularis]|uniref:WAT1-related protein n=1 Tax=Enterobius vermicularis TaxID=51028 RepID=A0A0N4V8S2_ENTVE|nr:unnamed protein product [Enterobius vermicularis]
MLSAKSTTMTMIGVEIVLACTAFIASFSILCAQLQSTSAYKDKQKPSIPLIMVCIISFLSIATTAYTYMGFSRHNAMLMLPHIIVRVRANRHLCLPHFLHYAFNQVKLLG